MGQALGSIASMPPKDHKGTSSIDGAIPAVGTLAFGPQKEPVHGYHKLFGFCLLEYFPQEISPSPYSLNHNHLAIGDASLFIPRSKSCLRSLYLNCQPTADTVLSLASAGPHQGPRRQVLAGSDLHGLPL